MSDGVYSSIYNENRDVIAEVMAAPGVGAHAVPTDGVNGGLLFNMNGNNGEPGVGAQPVNFNNEGGYEGTPPADAEQQQQQQQPAAASTNITEHFKAEEGTRAQEPQQEQGEGEEPTAAASIAIDNSTTPAMAAAAAPASAATGGASEHGNIDWVHWTPENIEDFAQRIGMPRAVSIAVVNNNAPGNPGRPRSACKCCQTSKSKPHCDLKTQFRRCSE